MSTPTGKPATADEVQQLTITNASIKLNFAKPGSDSEKFAGTISVPAGLQLRSSARLLLPAVQKVREAAARVSAGFDLNDKLSAKSGPNSFKIAVKSKNGVVPAQQAKFSTAISKGTYADSFKDAGLTGDASVKKQPRTVLFTLIFNNTIFQKAVALGYTATARKSGSATPQR